MAQLWPWATCVTITSRFAVSIILVVITTVKERCVVAISILLLHSNVTSVDILICHRWMERATKALVVAFTFAIMAMERRWPVLKLWRVGIIA